MEDNDLYWFYNSNIETFNKNNLLENPELSKQFIEARNLLESFRKGSLETHKVFDIDKLAKYFAINTLLNCYHAEQWPNIRFYYNPVTSLLEPVGYDGACNVGTSGVAKQHVDEILKRSEKNETLRDLFFKDKMLLQKYIQELEQVSQKSYLDDLFFELDEEIERSIKIMHKDYPIYYFNKELFYRNQEEIKNILNSLMGINVYFQRSLPSQNKAILSIANINPLPIEIITLVYNNSITFPLNHEGSIILPRSPSKIPQYQNYEFKVPENFLLKEKFSSNLKVNYKIFGTENIKNEEVLSWPYVKEDFLERDFIRQESNLSSSDFLEINKEEKVINIKEGMWILDQNLIIPPGFSVFVEKGTIIDLMNGAPILS